MTVQEAHEYLEDFQRIMTQHREAYSKKLIEANGQAISALEKQMPKKPSETDKARCIHCGCVVKRDERFCKNCGQALDWSDTE